MTYYRDYCRPQMAIIGLGVSVQKHVDSDADSNISQILLSDDDRKPSAQKDPPPGDISAKKKTLNLGIALFSHQKNNTDVGSFSNDDDDDSIDIPPNDKAPPTNKTLKNSLPNPRREDMKALLMKKSPYTRAIKTTFLNWDTKYMIPILESIHFQYKAYKKELTEFYATLQTSSRNNHSSASTYQTQTIKYLDQIEKEFDGAIDQYIEQMEAVAAKTRQTKQKKAKSVASSKGDRPRDFCDQMMFMQLDTTGTIAAYNHRVDSDHEDKISQFNLLAALCNVVFTELTRPDIAHGVDTKKLEEDTAPKTMPGLVSVIHDSIADATCAKFLEDKTASKQVPENNQRSNGSHLKNTIDGKNIIQLRAQHKGKAKKHPPPPTEMSIDTRAGSLFQPITIDGETSDSKLQPSTLVGTSSATPAKEIKQTQKYVRDVKMKAYNMSCKKNTAPETCDVLDLMTENLTN
eukprot:jgi/Psemu1/54154/gm1.54154_g